MLPMINRGFRPANWDDFFGKELFNSVFGDETAKSLPAANILENEDGFIIELAAPGLKKNDFKIDLKNNILRISSVKEDEKEEKGGNFMRREFHYSSFERSFTLPNTVDSEKIKASHKDGILSLSIPKKEEAKPRPPRQIEIS